jgi:pectate lyase
MKYIAPVVVFALVACGGGAAPSYLAPSSENSVRPFTAAATSLAGERLRATNVRLRNYSGSCDKSAIWITFTASGTATGPYSGTFTAHGSWFYVPGWVSGYPAFSEKFKITSEQTISGTASMNGLVGLRISCRDFRSVHLKNITWFTKSSKGALLVQMIKKGSLEESFR